MGGAGPDHPTATPQDGGVAATHEAAEGPPIIGITAGKAGTTKMLREPDGEPARVRAVATGPTEGRLEDAVIL
jgi:hypothetical protein